MKFKFICLIFLLASFNAYSQDIQLLSNFTANAFRLTSIAETEINSKWGYFNLSQASVEYDATDKLVFESSHYISRKLYKGLGLATGLTLQNDDIIPQLGIGVDGATGNFSYNLYLTGAYSITAEEIGTSFNSLLEYTLPLTDKWDLYNLLILEADLGEKTSSQQSLNIGFQRNKTLHFGVTLDFAQTDDFETNDTEIGAFLGVNF